MKKKWMSVLLAAALSAQCAAVGAQQEEFVVVAKTEQTDAEMLPETLPETEQAALETASDAAPEDGLPAAEQAEWILEPQSDAGGAESPQTEELPAFPEAAAAADTAQTGIALDAAHFPDEGFRAYLAAKADSDQDGSLSAQEIAAVKEIDVIGKGISSLSGLSYFTALTALYCDDNYLTELDVSGNIRLNHLSCANNQLAGLNLEKNTVLASLVCSNNQITALNISKNKYLQILRCAGNKLETLDVSNHTKLLILDCAKNAIKELDASQHPNLQILYCSENQLTSLSVSGDSKLQWLDCAKNSLTSLDVADALNVYADQDSAMNILNCADNALTSLTLGSKQYMKGLICSGNQLTVLDVSKLPDLRQLECANNALTSLNVTQNKKLQTLDCSGNRLTSLDLSSLYITETTVLPDCSNQSFELKFEKTDGGCQVDLTPFIGNASIRRITKEELLANACKEKSIQGNVFLLTQEGELKDGVLTFTEERLPDAIELVCATGYRKKAGEKDVLLAVNLRHTHTAEQHVEKEPGCTQDGVSICECAECGVTLETVLPALGHSFAETDRKAASCTEDGYVTETCSRCGEQKTQTLAGGHRYRMIKRMATATAHGVMYQECSVCGEKKENTEQVLHNYVNEKIDATCTQDGASYKACSVCGEEKAGTRTVLPAPGHSYGEYTVVQEPTVFEEGMRKRVCAVCGYEEIETLPKLSGTAAEESGQSGLSQQTEKTPEPQTEKVTEPQTEKTTEPQTEKATETQTEKAPGAQTEKTPDTQTETVLNTQTGRVSVTSLKVVQKRVTLKVGGRAVLEAVTAPADCQEKITYKSSNKKVATVSAAGIVKGVKAGTAKITVKAGEKTVPVQVKVTAPAVKAIKGVPTKKTLKAGKSFTLKPTLSPKGSTGKIKYKSSNKKVAAVTAAGKVKAVKKGTATITVSVGKVKAKCRITVK